MQSSNLLKKISSIRSLLHPVILIFLGALLLVFVLARFYMLETSPPGFFVDESSIGYNAWLIHTSGTDEHGVSYPLYFKAFGDYKNPIFVYSVAALFSIVRPSVATVRLVAALWGIGALSVFTVLLWTAHVRRYALLFTLFLVVSNPWFFQLSRVAFEVSALPFFLCVAMLAFFKLTQEGKQKTQVIIVWLLTFSLSLVSTFYVYTSGRVLAPVLLGGGLLLLYRKVPMKWLCIAGMVSCICILPALIWEVANPGAMLARYQVVGLSNYTHSTQEFLLTAGRNYALHLSPHFLIGGGDGNLRHVPSPFGILLTSSLPLALLGLFSLLTTRRGRFSSWIFLGVLISPIPSALTIQSPHALRSIGLLVFGCVLFWYGVEYLCSVIHGRLVLALCSVVVIVESIFFLSSYFTTYTRSARIWFDDPTVRMIDLGVTYQGPYFLSTKLYPGTSATLDFARIVYNFGDKKPFAPSVSFDPTMGIPDDSGVFFFDSDTCQVLPQKFRESAVERAIYGGNCLYTR